MEAPSPFKFPSKPLQPLSPERVNNMLPTSPSLPEMSVFDRKHGRTNSDVQGLVKRFEHLDVRDRDAENNERRKRHELELRRAQIAREEAETDVKRLREEVRRLKKEGDDGRERERKVGKRLEVVVVGCAEHRQANWTRLAEDVLNAIEWNEADSATGGVQPTPGDIWIANIRLRKGSTKGEEGGVQVFVCSAEVAGGSQVDEEHTARRASKSRHGKA